MKSKKGMGREMVFIVAFAIIVLSSIAVVYVVSVYNNKDFGMSDARAEIIKERLKECIEDENIDFSDFNISKCHLSKTALEKASFYIGFFTKENNKWEEKKIYGDGGFKERCEFVFVQSKKPENYPSCEQWNNDQVKIIIGIKEDNDKINKGVNTNPLEVISEWLRIKKEY